jgi:hypothetical protein
MNPEVIIPVLGMMTGIIIPLIVFVFLYLESKDKNKTILEISKNIDDPSKLEDLVGLLDERKKNQLITEGLEWSHFLLALVFFFLAYSSLDQS